MQVDLIAHTTFHGNAAAKAVGNDWRPEAREAWGDLGSLGPEADWLAEFAGRSCYQSWSRPNPKTATTEGYLANIINQGHFSVLEHASATFYVQGVSRALTHELVRHRHLSFSQLSQRFVDETEGEFVVPPALQDVREYLDDAHTDATRIYQDLVSHLIGKGHPRKQAREAARAVLPNMQETKIVVTGNHRAWRDFLAKRWHVAADAEIRLLAGKILDHLNYLAPSSFQDIPSQPYGTPVPRPEPEPIITTEYEAAGYR